jgi:hypothetical protein
MAVAFDAKTATGTSVNGVNTLTVSNMTVGSISNGALLLLLNNGDGATGFPSGLTATWDSGGTNQSMTQVPGTLVSSGYGGTSALYGVLAPTSGNKSLVVSWTGNHEMHAQCISFSGVDQTSVAVAFPHGTVNSGTANPATVTVTTANGNAVVAGHTQSAGFWQSTNNNTIDLDNTGPNTGWAGNYVLSSGATATMTATIGASSQFDSIGTDILAAAAGGVVTQVESRLMMGVGM